MVKLYLWESKIILISNNHNKHLWEWEVQMLNTKSMEVMRDKSKLKVRLLFNQIKSNQMNKYRKLKGPVGNE